MEWIEYAFACILMKVMYTVRIEINAWRIFYMRDLPGEIKWGSYLMALGCPIKMIEYIIWGREGGSLSFYMIFSPSEEKASHLEKIKNYAATKLT